MSNWQTFRDDDWTQTSFTEPVPAPNIEPTASPLVCLQVNRSWIPYILGSLFQLQQQGTWDASSPGADVASQQAQMLQSMWSVGGNCSMVTDLRLTDTCTLQYSTDGGATWTDVPGWDTYAASCFVGPEGPPGETGPVGPAGANGITPELRWSGCNLQISYDSGATWTDLPGWTIAALQACLSGTPGDPQGVGTDQQACNIAAWLASNVIQQSIGSIAGAVTAGTTLLDSVVTLIDLIPGLDATIGLGVTAGALLFNQIAAAGASAFTSASTDPVLYADLLCAIYDAIRADGYVTSSNFATLVSNVNAISYGTPVVIGVIVNYLNSLGFTGINAIQATGSVEVGNCSSCSSPPAGCNPFLPTVVGAGIGSYVSTGANAGVLTQSAAGYKAIFSTASPGTGTVWSINATVASGNDTILIMSKFDISGECASGADWSNDATYWVVARPDTSWSFVKSGTTIAGGSGANAGGTLKLQYVPGPNRVVASWNTTFLAEDVTGDTSTYMAGASAFDAAGVVEHIQLCVGS